MNGYCEHRKKANKNLLQHSKKEHLIGLNTSHWYDALTHYKKWKKKQCTEICILSMENAVYAKRISYMKKRQKGKNDWYENEEKEFPPW